MKRRKKSAKAAAEKSEAEQPEIEQVEQEVAPDAEPEPEVEPEPDLDMGKAVAALNAEMEALAKEAEEEPVVSKPDNGKPAKQPVPVNEILWKKLDGTLYLGNKVYKKGDTFRATPNQIPKAFRDTVQALEVLPADRPVDYVQAGYRIESSTTGGMYNIIDGQGKRINSKPLTIQEAEDITATLG